MTPLLLQSPKRWGWDEGLRGRGGACCEAGLTHRVRASDKAGQTHQEADKPVSLVLHLQVMPLQMLVQRPVLACASRQGYGLLCMRHIRMSMHSWCARTV